MDSFEKSRWTAAQLHGKLVDGGVNPLDSMRLVEAAATHSDLELHWLAPNDPALNGAHALFDEQSGSIFCRDDGTETERAQLVAHEIGHAELHTGGSNCNAIDIDPSRSTEAPAVGLRRVEDYGARERRELQANVFAREFLLPRNLARDLYLEQGLTATAIAGRTRLPKALVRQQLFDALLLDEAPELEIATSPAGRFQPDPSQERAIAHRSAPFQLQAGPGTGKTRALIGRVSSLLQEGVDPGSILVLTFSNRAAAELADRIASVAPEDVTLIWIGTFHSFGLDLVRRHHDRLGHSPKPTLLDRSKAIEILEEILPTLPIVHYQNLWDPAMVLGDMLVTISRAKDELLDAVGFRKLCDSMRKEALDETAVVAAEKCLEVSRVYDLYEEILRERDAVDFGDLIMRPALLLESDRALRYAVQSRHRHVLVDEYQDVNRASGRLLKAIAGEGKRLWVVGDARQSIYRFRGASSENMSKFIDDYRGAVVDQLTVNYRSTEQIVNSFAAVAPHLGASHGMLRLKLRSYRGTGPGVPEIHRYETLDDELAGVAACIRDLEGRGVLLRDQAVLCRSNRRLNDFAVALEAGGIPVLHLGSLFERDEVRDLLALLSLAVDQFGGALVRVGAMARYGLSLQDTHAAIRELAGRKRPAIESLGTLSQTAGLSADGAAALDRLASDLKGLHPRDFAWAFLSTYLLDRTDLMRKIARPSSVAGRIRAIAVWQFLNFIREQDPVPGGRPIQRTLDRVRHLVLYAEERDLRQVPTVALRMNAVRLMTVHASKGLEFEAVHVPGLTVASFPSSNRPPRCPPPAGLLNGSERRSIFDSAKRMHDHEEECLFFVALSRAMTHLHLYLSKKQRNGRNRSPSRLLKMLPPTLTSEVAHFPSQVPKASPIPNPIEVTFPDGWPLTDSRLTAYDKCPKRFFYTHMVGIGNARKSTAFTQTHDCLHELLRWLGNARPVANPTMHSVEAKFESIWRERGPVDHAFAKDYRQLAMRFVQFLVKSSENRRFLDEKVLELKLAGGTVTVEPSEVSQLEDGRVAVRRIRTGRKRSKEYDRLEYSLYRLAANARFGPRAVVQALHLADEASDAVSVTNAKLNNRRNRAKGMITGISSGQFLPKPNHVTCPRCPHFFICPAVPDGPLDLSK